LRELAEVGMIVKTSPRKYVVSQPSPSASRQMLGDTVVFFSKSPRENWKNDLSVHRVENGVAEAVAQGHHNLLTICDFDKVVQSPEWFRGDHPLGVVVSEYFAGREELLPTLRSLQDADTMVVVNYDAPWLAGFDRVISDQAQGARDLALWLFRQGRRRILRLHLADASKYWIPMRDRGYEQATAMAGFAMLRPVCMPLATLPPVDADTRREQARRLAGGLSESLLGWQQPFDAIMLSSDEYCGAAALACEMIGLKPNQDVWIAGFDNTWDFFSHGEGANDKPMATVDNRQDLAGQKAVDILLRRRQGQLSGPAQLHLVPTEVVIPN
jgi:DNA-binding LacI/PurR family transcriptional regulator